MKRKNDEDNTILSRVEEQKKSAMKESDSEKIDVYWTLIVASTFEGHPKSEIKNIGGDIRFIELNCLTESNIYTGGIEGIITRIGIKIINTEITQFTRLNIPLGQIITIFKISVRNEIPFCRIQGHII